MKTVINITVNEGVLEHVDKTKIKEILVTLLIINNALRKKGKLSSQVKGARFRVKHRVLFHTTAF